MVSSAHSCLETILVTTGNLRNHADTGDSGELSLSRNSVEGILQADQAAEATALQADRVRAAAAATAAEGAQKTAPGDLSPRRFLPPEIEA